MPHKGNFIIAGIAVASSVVGFVLFILSFDGFVHGYAGLPVLNIPEAAGLWGLITFVVLVIAGTIELLRSR